MAKRGYSREFPMKGPAQTKRRAITVEVSWSLAKAFRESIATRELVQRQVLARWIRNFSEGRRPDEDA